MEDGKLLSIVVPTKNRCEYAKFFIDTIKSYQDERIELVIQDNSEDDRFLRNMMKEKSYGFVKYFHSDAELDLVENSEMGVSHATGKYVCFMGDDDIVTRQLADFVEAMDSAGYESAIFARDTSYFWPGIKHKAHRFPSLSIRKYKGKIREIHVKKEFKRLMGRGAMTMLLTPQLYHGVIKRECLEKVKSIAGSYFPAPCPDMAVCVALNFTVKKHLYCDMPYILSGAAPKSAAALGAKHEHKGKISEINTLPNDTEQMWESTVPKIWTGPTIYAESAIKSIKNMRHEKMIERYNFAYFYAYFYVFCFEYRNMVIPYVRGLSVNKKIRFLLNVMCLVLMRSAYFVRNIVLSKLHFGFFIWDNVSDSFAAEQLIDEKISDIDIVSMFERIKG